VEPRALPNYLIMQVKKGLMMTSIQYGGSRDNEFRNISKRHFAINKVGDVITITDLSSNGTLLNGMRLPQNVAVPLPNLSIISISYVHNKTFQFFNRLIQKQNLDMVPSGFFNLYTLEDIVLGSGITAVVRKGFRNTDFTDKVAVKIISKRNKNLREDKDFTYEVDLLKGLNHPNIVRAREYFENEHFIYIVMDFSNHGDLCSYIRQRGALSEEKSKTWFHILLKAISYLHTNDIIHRDLKPENILLHNQAVILNRPTFGLVELFCT